MALIRHYIRSGQLKPGELLPTEAKLCELYGVSRTTIRLALDQLAEEKLIIRQRGKGSYVESPKLNRHLNHLYSFTEDMRSMGVKSNSIVIENNIVKAPDEIAKTLAIPSEAPVFKLIRVRYANEEPILHETSYIPYFLCKGMENEDFSDNSLYQLLQYKYQMKLVKAVETYEAVKLGKHLADLLSCTVSSAAFRIHRTGYLENEIPFEFTYSTVRSDKCIFTVELNTGKSQVYFSRKITL
jgi:GntR family transcriptional regulator